MGKETDPFRKLFGSAHMQVKLAALWIFLMFNYAYADILTLMDPSVLKELVGGTAGGMALSPELLLAGAILMEIPIAMIVLSLILSHRANRWANIIAGSIKTLAVLSSMFVGAPASYYLFFGIIEIFFSALIVWYAWNWRKGEL